MINKVTDRLFDEFVDDVLSVPWDIRSGLMSIAERHYQGQMFTSEQIYGYIFWRVYDIPIDDFLSWGPLFKDYDLYKPEKYIVN